MHTLRRLALASALLLTPALAGAARAGDVTYPQLQNQTTVIDTDLLAAWRNTGPLAKINASTLAAYLQGKFNSDYLQPSNNLSDLANVATARSNLLLGTAATQNTGTSGANVCLMNQNCTWSGTQTLLAKLTTAVPTTSSAMFNLQPGAAPTSPVNGDVWGTSSGVFGRVNGTTQQFAFLTSNVASATQLQNAQTINVSGGDISCTGQSFNGTAGITIGGCGLAVSGVTAGTYGDSGHVSQVMVDAKGRVTGASSVAISYPSQLPSQSQPAELTTNGSSASWTPRAALEAYSCSSGGCSVGMSTNVSQFNRLGVGIYQIVFTAAMPSNTYVFLCTVSGTAPLICTEQPGDGAGFVQLEVTNGSGTHTDSIGNINVLVIAN